jgi:hypothetical protein
VIAAGGDTQTRDMEQLVTAMNPAHEYKFAGLIELARDNRLFARLIPKKAKWIWHKSSGLVSCSADTQAAFLALISAST